MDDLTLFFQTVLPWGVGLLVSLAVGHAFVVLFRYLLNLYMTLPEEPDDPKTKDFPPWLTGVIERSIFTIWVGTAGAGSVPVSAVVAGMGAWLALKLATNWNRRKIDSTDDDGKIEELRVIRRAWIALMSGVVSLVWALIGGLIWNGMWWPY